MCDVTRQAAVKRRRIFMYTIDAIVIMTHMRQVSIEDIVVAETV